MVTTRYTSLEPWLPSFAHIGGWGEHSPRVSLGQMIQCKQTSSGLSVSQELLGACSLPDEPLLQGGAR